MIRENRQLFTDEPAEFEKEPVEVQDCRKITDHFRGIYRIIYPDFMKDAGGCQQVTGWTCKHLDVNQLCPKISPITAYEGFNLDK